MQALFVVVGLMFAQVSGSAESAVEIRVLSFNIRYGTANDGPNSWPARRELVFEVIRRGNYDFVGLQEALRFQLDEIAHAVPGYVEIGVGRRDGRTGGEYSALLVRSDRWGIDQAGTFWLSDTPEVPGSRSWGNRIPRIVTWARLVHKGTGRPVFVYNTHFDHQSARSRELSARLLLSRINERSPRDPVIVTGDFNAAEQEPPIRLLKDARLTGGSRLLDSYRVVDAEGPAGTFHGFTGRDDGRKIDYVFCTDDFTVVSAQIIRLHRNGRYPSDHYPVDAILRLGSARN